MFKIFTGIVAIAFLTSCNNPTNTTSESKTDSLINSGVNDILLQTNFEIEKLKGLYSGTFDGSPISISINYVSGKNVSGYNIHKGLKRNMRGTMEPFGTQIKLLLDEPGNNRYDGHFEMFIDTSSFAGKGTWKPKNDSSLKKKDFSFAKKKEQAYNDLVSTWSDTLNRSIQLKNDGSAIFSYYSDKGKPQEQMQNIGGNWQQKADSIIVYWQPNTIFPGRRSSFFIMRVKEWNGEDSVLYLNGLKGEKADWIQMMP